jgi:REP element-mobilizing transposase RayT
MERIMRTHSRIVIGHHIILHGYGEWLPNDPRGSGSEELRQDKLADLGSIHRGRKRVQPSKQELRRFYQNANPRLDFPPLWFDNAKRQAISEAFANVAMTRRYTVWVCAVLCNHAHLVIRRHRDDALTIWRAFANTSRNSLRLFADVNPHHPVWSSRPYKVFLYTPEDVRRCIDYVQNNPEKENLPPQTVTFLKPYDGWPHRKR